MSSRGLADRECLFADIAAIAARTRMGQSDGLVAFADRNSVIDARYVRAGWFWCDHQIIEKARTLF